MPWPVRGTITSAEYQLAWTGITGPWCDFCSWAWHRDRMEIKFISRSCGVHNRMLSRS